MTPVFDWKRIEQQSMERRTVRFDGGFLVRGERLWSGNLCGPSKESMLRIRAWYAALFARLARRLRYLGSRKERSARRRLRRQWGPQGVPMALARIQKLEGT